MYTVFPVFSLYTVSPTGRFCYCSSWEKHGSVQTFHWFLNLTLVQWVESLAVLSTRILTRGYASWHFFVWAPLVTHKCGPTHLMPQSMSSVHWVCLSLVWHHPLIQSYSSPELISSSPTSLHVNKHSTKPHHRWPPGKLPEQTWQWW